MTITVISIIFWITIVSAFILVNKWSVFYSKSYLSSNKYIFNIILCAITIVICILPMGVSPTWNGEMAEYRNQYEVLAKSFLEGHLYLDYEDNSEQELLDLNNPYDPVERTDKGVNYHWDHAFYNGHYYMYFGVVPVILLFLPYRFITGCNLTTYHATQVFVALYICGIFFLFHLLTKLFFKSMSKGICLFAAIVMSMIGVWYCVGTPAMYCTAISAGLCLEIWSVIFFVRSLWIEKSEKGIILWMLLGSLFGALAFGCRPPIAIANILVIPVFIFQLRNEKITKCKLIKLLISLIPYFVIGILLMIYNYERFNSIFEFGQSYQITVTDQRGYPANPIGIKAIFEAFFAMFFKFRRPLLEFPYISYCGCFYNYPILMLPYFACLWEPIRKSIRKRGATGVIIILLILPFLITVLDRLNSPGLCERYKLDIHWLLTILCFVFIGLVGENLSVDKRRVFNHFVVSLLFYSLFCTILLMLVPFDSNITAYYPEVLELCRKIFEFGR